MYITALFMTTVIALLVVANTTRSVAEIQSAQLFEQATRSFHAAEGVVADALSEFMDGGTDAIVNFSTAEGWQTTGGGTCNSNEACQRTTSLGGTTVTISVNNLNATQPVLTAMGSAGLVVRKLEVVIERPNITIRAPRMANATATRALCHEGTFGFVCPSRICESACA